MDPTGQGLNEERIAPHTDLQKICENVGASSKKDIVEVMTGQLSKNAIRKKRRWEAIKQARKDKQFKRKKKQAKTQKIKDNTSNCTQECIKSPRLSKKEQLRIQRQRLLNILEKETDVKGGNEKGSNLLQICIDFQFGERMTDKELSRLASQVCRVYGANKSSEHPAKLSFVNLDEKGRTFQVCCAKNAGFDKYLVHRTSKGIMEEYNSVIDRLVYLTPDSSIPLEDLELDKVYVIGGFVDDTVQKNVTLNYAGENKISTARLPIKEHCSKSEEKGSFKQILTINQVFEILQKFIECKNWATAITNGIPQRTGFK